jgi:CBS domain-containing protein
MTTTGPRRSAVPPLTGDDDPPVTTTMTTRIVGVTSDSAPSMALRLMKCSGVHHLPVFDGIRCRGLLLETDVVDHLLADSPADRSIARLVRPAPSVSTTARRSDAARSMVDEGTNAVLVTDHERVVGIVTATDLFRSLIGMPPSGRH